MDGGISKGRYIEGIERIYNIVSLHRQKKAAAGAITAFSYK